MYIPQIVLRVMNTSEKEVKRTARKRLYVESFVVFFIIVSPFIFKIHDYFSKDPQATLEFMGLTIDKNGFNNINSFIWFFVSKFVPLYLLIVWFLTCKHWWYHILLIPICMYAFQLFEVMVWDNLNIDTKNVLWLLPICMVVIPFVYFIRVKIYDKYVHGIDLEAMNAELQYYKSKEKDELRKAGIYTQETISPERVEKDLSDETPKRTINQLLGSIQTSGKSLF